MFKKYGYYLILIAGGFLFQAFTELTGIKAALAASGLSVWYLHGAGVIALVTGFSAAWHDRNRSEKPSQ